MNDRVTAVLWAVVLTMVALWIWSLVLVMGSIAG